MVRDKTKQVAMLLLVLAVVGVISSRWAQCRQIPFDSSLWQQARNSGSLAIRYRMISDLRIRLGSMMPVSLEEVGELLGPDDANSLKPNGLAYHNESVFPKSVYLVGRNKYWAPLSSKGWQFHLLFDKNNELRRVYMAVE